MTSIKAAAVVLMVAVTAGGQWGRVVYSGKGESRDVPSAHPLAYFTGNPFLRDDGDDLCADCSPANKAASVRKYTARAEVRPVGVLAGYRILDILYYLGSRGDPTPMEVKWKAIVVQTAADSYKEIFHLSTYYTTVSPTPSRIVRSGDESVLATMDSDGGNGGGCWQGYWRFDRDGPHSLDFSRVEEAINAGIPANTRAQTSCTFLDVGTQEIRSGVQKTDAECHACGWVGDVTARFRLEGAIAIAVSVTFQPSVENPRGGSRQ